MESQQLQKQQKHIKLLQQRGNDAVEQLHITTDLKKLTEKELRRAQSKSVSPSVTHVQLTKWMFMLLTYVQLHYTRIEATSKRYREQAVVNVQQTKKLKVMSTELLAVKKQLSNKNLHLTSVQMHRNMANEALEQRNVARDKLKALQQELDRWKTK